ncbi:MAG: T9SS type A sorting domain-containing protein [Bacteroidales bacterium]|nr:T9SS type A sorting domain-containing protein [Bacteroidales bacterium]
MRLSAILVFMTGLKFCIPVSSQTVTDFDNNTYRTIALGDQIWMTENLRTTHYSDGTIINDGRSFTFYSMDVAMDASDSTKYWFCYNNDTANAATYGCLYNWFAAVNGNYFYINIPEKVQGVCPVGWHIPSIDEWDQLKAAAGTNGSTELQQGGFTGFNALLGGYRHDLFNQFNGINNIGAYITTKVEPDGYIMLFTFHSDDTANHHWTHRKTTGYSVRCIKDSETQINTNPLENRTNFRVFPNPASVEVNIQFTMDVPEVICLSVYNALGQNIEILLNGFTEAGRHEIVLSCKSLKQGVYFFSLLQGSDKKIQKVILY